MVTITDVAELALHPLASVTVMVYVPLLPFADRVGLCVVDTNEFGPLQVYEVRPDVPPVSVIVP